MAEFADTIFYMGPIGTAGVDHLERRMTEEPKRKFEVLLVRSEGGNGLEAERLAKLLNERSMQFYVDDDSLCASACIPAFLHAENHFAAPGARFLFHQGIGIQQGLPFLPHMLWRGEWPTEPVFMDEWANEISPRLLTYLSECSKGNRLRDTHGLAMRWEDIQLIVEGRPRRSCDEALADEPRRGL